MPEEIWAAIANAPGYEVSNLGRVRTLDRTILGRGGRYELRHGKVLKQQVLKNGYHEVYISLGGKRKHRTIHSLVAEAFLGERPKGFDIMHVDGDRSNNIAGNLRYGSRAENLHSTYSYGGKQATGKLSLEDVDDIRLLLSRGVGPQDIANRFNVHPSTIRHVRDGKSFAWYKKEAS